jgi:hypothetical protein
MHREPQRRAHSEADRPSGRWLVRTVLDPVPAVEAGGHSVEVLRSGDCHDPASPGKIQSARSGLTVSERGSGRPCMVGGSAVDLDDRNGALVIRVWLESGGGFRARVIAADLTDPSRSDAERTIAVAASPGEVMAAVRGWLDDFLDGATDPVDSR